MEINQQIGQMYQWLQNLEQGVKGANAAARRAAEQFQHAAGEVAQMRQINAQQAQELSFLKGVVDGMRVSGGKTGAPGVGQVGRSDMLTIEEIPGRRVPFDLTMHIGIPDGQTSPLDGSYVLSMDGPFVAVARYATFISSYTFQVTNGESVTRYTGRTWGRQRPISSTLDLMDAVAGWVDGIDSDFASVGCGEGVTAPPPAVISRPTSRAAQRSMGFDGFVEIKSSTYPRQNQQVPTSLWAPGFSQMLQLPVLDYWEKGETIEVKIEPLHTLNPRAGNVEALLGSMPYLDGQYDGHEGVRYPSWQCTAGQPDVIARRPSGVLVIGFLGFKILQPAGVRMR